MTHINASNVCVFHVLTKADLCPLIYCLNHVSYASYAPELSQSNMHILIKDKVDELKKKYLSDHPMFPLRKTNCIVKFFPISELAASLKDLPSEWSEWSSSFEESSKTVCVMLSRCPQMAPISSKYRYFFLRPVPLLLDWSTSFLNCCFIFFHLFIIESTL